jgi:hypothetical protein
VAKADRAVHPDLQRFLAKRMGATTTETNSSHVIMLSQPNLVVDVIRKAASAVQKELDATALAHLGIRGRRPWAFQSSAVADRPCPVGRAVVVEPLKIGRFFLCS